MTLRSFGVKYLAVKILTADVTQRHVIGQTRGLHFLQLIRDKGPDSWGLPVLCDHFNISGPHGPHLCFVMYLLGSSISELRKDAPDKALPLHLVKIIIAQLTDSVAQLHELGIIHTGTRTNGAFECRITSSFHRERLCGQNQHSIQAHIVYSIRYQAR